METLKIGICEGSDFSENAINTLEKIGSVEVFSDARGDIKEFIRDKNIIFIRLRYQINDDFIRDCNELRYICSPTTGLNHISISNTRIKTISLKGEYDFLSSIRATPEHVFGLTLGLLRNYSHAFLNEYNKNFDRNLYKGFEIYGNHIGIIGLGRIGKIIAHYFASFGANVGYYDTETIDTDIVEKCESIEDLIDRNNIIILSTNYNVENDKMISEELLLRMKGKYFVNAARGELVDESALIKLIKKGWFKGVAIDVLAGETTNKDALSKLIKSVNNQNVIITPHIGGATYTSMCRTEEFVAVKLLNELGNF